MFAPFDGVITDVRDDQGGRGMQVWLEPEVAPNWQFVIFHLNLTSDLQEHSRITAGQKIGTANVQNSPNFDISLKYHTGISSPRLTSPFLHFAPRVLEEYKKHGITLENSIISKNVRDASPCPTRPGSGPDLHFSSPYAPENWVMLKKLTT